MAVNRAALPMGTSRADNLHGPVYTLHCRSESGELVRLCYDPHASILSNENGAPLIADSRPRAYDDAPRISPSRPGVKSASPRTLKIQLGLRCNYACSYCSQSSQIESATVTRTADADEFLEGLDRWLAGVPSRIEFWGGEPLLYFAKLRRLVPALRARFREADLVIVTNGSLIDEEIVAFIEAYDIVIAVSHDGPGQPLRGPDPFDAPERAQWLKLLWQRRGRQGKMSFNVVFSPANCDLRRTHAWFAEKVGDPQVTLSTEGIVQTYDEHTASGSGHFSADQYRQLRRSMLEAFRDGTLSHYCNINEKAEDFIDSLYQQRPSSALGQKCGMDRSDQLAVDLRGHVLTCQNTGGEGRHRIGSVGDLPAARLDTAWHWSYRECCNYCPVLQLCQGSCMFLEGELFAQSCENEFHYNSAILGCVVKHLTGLDLERIEGDIRRPVRKPCIPIRRASSR